MACRDAFAVDSARCRWTSDDVRAHRRGDTVGTTRDGIIGIHRIDGRARASRAGACDAGGSDAGARLVVQVVVPVAGSAFPGWAQLARERATAPAWTGAN